MTSGRNRAERGVRRRSATESLLSIVLVLEALVVFFGTLVVYSLRVLPATTTFVSGAIVFVLMLVVGRLLRHDWALWPAWVLQVVLVASGILVPLMYFIGGIFVALYIYCFITGRRLDRKNAQYFAKPGEVSPPDQKEPA